MQEAELWAGALCEAAKLSETADTHAAVYQYEIHSRNDECLRVHRSLTTVS